MPMSVNNEPIRIAIRRPNLSAAGAATKAPAKPPMKTTVVIRPSFEELGLPMADRFGSDLKALKTSQAYVSKTHLQPKYP